MIRSTETASIHHSDNQQTATTDSTQSLASSTECMSIVNNKLSSDTRAPQRQSKISLENLSSISQPESHTHISPISESEIKDKKDTILHLTKTGETVLIPCGDNVLANDAVNCAHQAFKALEKVSDEQITTFFNNFADRLSDPDITEAIQKANTSDVEKASAKGRSTTRLILSDTMLMNMIEGLKTWAKTPSPRGEVVERIVHDDFVVDKIKASLGPVAFVFEGRPNVVPDATGVLRAGNSVVLRIGSDALDTATAIMEMALKPALKTANLPEHSVVLLNSKSHAATHAMVANDKLALVVVRGSGKTVDFLGAIAQSVGNQVSLHGRGGAWMFGTENTNPQAFKNAIIRSLDRKVCNTTNTLCINKNSAKTLVPALLSGLEQAAQNRNTNFKLHVAQGAQSAIPEGLFKKMVVIDRADGRHEESQAQLIDQDLVGKEHEWENSPEVTLLITDHLEQGIEAFNTHSPLFVASLITDDADEKTCFFNTINAPAIGDDLTRWVDGQYALKKPELGLSNWEFGRLPRSAILTGGDIVSYKLRYTSLSPSMKSLFKVPGTRGIYQILSHNAHFRKLEHSADAQARSVRQWANKILREKACAS